MTLATSPPPRARWLVPSQDPRRASLRYRCLYPIEQLAHWGLSVGFLQEQEPPGDLIVVFDAWSLFPTISGEAVSDNVVASARRFKQSGVRLILDNCDNQFAANQCDAAWSRGLDRLRELACLADRIVVCSNALGDAMTEIPGVNRDIVVIDDPVEERIRYPGDSLLRSIVSPRRKRCWLNYIRHWSTLARERRAGRTPLVWFGSHGNQFSPGGMLDILSVRSQLEETNRKYPVSLTVISNNHGKFAENFSDWSFPVHYLEWDRINFLALLRLHDVSVIPAQLNSFTRCKSTNRVTLSLWHGLAVIADPIPSYATYSGATRIGNWLGSLEYYLADESNRRTHVQIGRQLVQTQNSIEAIAAAWRNLIFPLS